MLKRLSLLLIVATLPAHASSRTVTALTSPLIRRASFDAAIGLACRMVKTSSSAAAITTHDG